MPRQRVGGGIFGRAGGGGYGMTSQKSWLGQTEQQYDPLRSLQGRLAEEQWGLQKQAYGEQQKAARGSAGALQKLIGQYTQGTAEAKSANEARYQQLLQIAGQTTGQRAADIRSAGAEEESNVMQRLRQLGMSGTTVAPTLKGGVRGRTEASLNRLADTMQQTKLGIIERREDVGPDPNVMLSLAQQIGKTGGGGFQFQPINVG